MKKGLDALTQAVMTGTPEPTNEAQRKELSEEWRRTGSAETLAKLEMLEALRAVTAVADDYTVALPVPAMRMYEIARAAIAKAGGAK